MVEKVQGLNKLRQPKGVFTEGSLCGQKENGWWWLSKITAIFKSLGRPRMDNQVREEVVRNRRKVPAKTRDPVVESIRVRSNNTSKTGRKSPGKTVRAPASKNKAKSKTV